MESRKLTLLLRFVALSLFLAGCGGAVQESEDPWKPVFEEALRHADTEFEREVLADMAITRGEYEEAHDRLVQCIQDAGLEAEIVEDDNGLFSLTVSHGPNESTAVVDQCSRGTTDIIAPLYNDIARNPDNRDFEELIVECLVAKDAVDSGFTVNDLDELLDEVEAHPPSVSEALGDCIEDPLNSG